MHRSRKGWLVILFFLFIGGISAQTTITGIVSDENGETLVGVNVVVKGTRTGTVTDLNGSYSISAFNNSTLVFSYIGMRTSEEEVKNRRTINVTLYEERKELDELVVIAYGTVKKRDLTGSVASVKTSDIDLTSSTSIGHALKGKVSGLSIVQNSAQPGGGLEFRVRGAGSLESKNDPLYIVDGIPIAQLDPLGTDNTRLDPGTQSVLNFINPEDIASIEVLKDASATAIYGSRAGHGVILITTKKGSEGKTTVNYGASYGIQKHSNIFDLYNLQEWMAARNKSSWDKWMYENRVDPYGPRTLNEAMTFPRNGLAYKLPYTDLQIQNAGEGTDWVDLITQIGSIQQHNLSVQGGSSQTKFFVSLNYLNQEGIIKNSGIERYAGKFSLDHEINKYVKMGLNVMASRTDNNNRALGDRTYEHSGLLRAAVQMGPHIQAIDEDGNYPINPELPTQPNPYSLLNVKDISRMDRLLANANVTIEPISGLSVKLSGAADIAYQSRNTYMPKSTLWGQIDQGYATINQSANDQYLLEATVNYLKTINENHRFGFLAGMSYEQFNNSSHYLDNRDFITDAFLWYSMQSGVGAKSVRSSGSEDKMQSFFTRLNYTLMGRYLLTATFRADGASIFAENHKWGYFPSVALAWNMGEENFIKNLNTPLSMLKWRVSYGQTGNSTGLGNSAYAAYSAYSAWNAIDKSKIIGVFPSRLENPNLKWETTTEFNIGLDVALFDGKISGSFELYNRVISDLLNFKSLNVYQDISRVIANIGKTQSKGFEASINTKNITTENFRWATDFTFSMYRDLWLERTNDWKPAVYEREKDPIRPIYSFRADHIMQIGEMPPSSQDYLVPGQIVLKDLNGYLRDEYGDPLVENGRFVRTGAPDNTVDEADMQLIGTTDPGFIAGLNNRFWWKNIDFSFDMNGLFDRIMQDPTYLDFGACADGIGQFGYNGLRILDKRWTPENPSTKYPSSFYGWDNARPGDWFYQKAWFIRLQNVTIGYTLPNTPVLKKLFSSVRIYANANNLYVFTPYTGLDPETDVYTAAYPNARTFTFGFDIRF